MSQLFSRRQFLFREVPLLLGGILLGCARKEGESIPQTPSPSPTATLSPSPTSTPFPKSQEITPTMVPLSTPTLTPTPPPVQRIESKLLPPPGSFIWKGDTTKPQVALTFDDGWQASNIKKFIGILERTNTRLTVFLTGQAINNAPTLCRELWSFGCEFGCHSYTHRNLAVLSPAEIVEEIERSQNALDKALGRSLPFEFFRPPGGDISDNTIRALKQKGLRGVIWSLSGWGTSPIATPRSVADRILSLAGNGDITLHHFINNDIEVLEKIIGGLRNKGLSPVTLKEVL